MQVLLIICIMCRYQIYETFFVFIMYLSHRVQAIVHHALPSSFISCIYANLFPIRYRCFYLFYLPVLCISINLSSRSINLSRSINVSRSISLPRSFQCIHSLLCRFPMMTPSQLADLLLSPITKQVPSKNQLKVR